MARKIIDQLFPKQNNLSSGVDNDFVSLKDWKILVSRLDRTQSQVESCNEKMDIMYSKVMQWLRRVREKIDAVSKNQEEMNSITTKMFKDWEQKLLDWVQPEQRKEDQKRVMSLMQRHSQFIQSYNKQIDTVKNAVSKNEYQVYQLLEQMRTIRVEMDLISRNENVVADRRSSSSKTKSLCSSELNLSP